MGMIETTSMWIIRNIKKWSQFRIILYVTINWIVMSFLDKCDLITQNIRR